MSPLAIFFLTKKRLNDKTTLIPRKQITRPLMIFGTLEDQKY